MKKLLAFLVVLVTIFSVAGCTDAATVDHNISKEADQFRILRRIVFVNGITDKYLLSIEGYCSIKDAEGQLEVVCKTPEGYKKHFLGLSDNVTYVAEQMTAANVSANHYKIIFKPEVIVPEVGR